MPKKANILGKRYGLLTVIEETNERKNGHVVWKCQCDCGNISYVTKTNLEHSTKSCGCLKKKITSEQNTVCLLNKRFNKLTVLSQAESKNGNSYWNCKCDCGNFITVKGILLSSNGVKSCGCLKSFGESKIISFLQQHNINFEKQKSFDTCRFSDSNNLAKFDFYLPDYNMLIEYDGEQHFSYRGNGWNTEDHFKKTQKRDKYKNDWAKKNNITLIRIKYTEKENIESILENLLQREEKENACI